MLCVVAAADVKREKAVEERGLGTGGWKWNREARREMADLGGGGKWCALARKAAVMRDEYAKRVMMGDVEYVGHASRRRVALPISLWMTDLVSEVLRQTRRSSIPYVKKLRGMTVDTHAAVLDGCELPHPARDDLLRRCSKQLRLDFGRVDDRRVGTHALEELP